MQLGIGPQDVAEGDRRGAFIHADLDDAPRPGGVAAKQVRLCVGVHRPGRDEPGGERYGA